MTASDEGKHGTAADTETTHPEPGSFRNAPDHDLRRRLIAAQAERRARVGRTRR